MSRVRRKADNFRSDHGAVMTFDEIGAALGITRGGAWMLYKSAMRKLRKRRVSVQELRELVDFRARRAA